MTEALSHRRTAIGWRQVLWPCAIVLGTLAAYFPAMRAGWVWDDNEYITDNVHLRTLHGLRQIWLRLGAVPQYYPLTHTTFWIEYHLWKLNPLGYHLDNVILHIANVLLFGLILRRLMVPGYALAAALFALHPVQVESVAWVSERKNVLSGFFYLLALLSAISAWQIAPRPPASESPRFLRSYVLCFGYFALALLSKTVTASLPLVIALLIWWKRGRVSRREAAGLAPLLFCGIAMGALTGWMEKHVVGAMGAPWNWSIAQRILIAGRAVWFYLLKLVWPHPLMIIYAKWSIDPHAVVPWLFPIAALLAAAVCLKLGRASAIVAIFFVISLFPALGFANVYPMQWSFVADHFQYLAVLGPIAAAGFFLRRNSVIATLILFGLAGLTWQQCHVYTDREALWRDVTLKDSALPLGHVNYGLALLECGRVADAEAEIKKALLIDPNNLEAELALGSVAQTRGDLPGAESYFRAAAAAGPDNGVPHWQLGKLYRRLDRADDAIHEFDVAATLLANPAPALEQIGEVELARQCLDIARGYFDRVLAADPDVTQTHNNLAAIALTSGDFAEAERQCRSSLEIDPDNLTACYDLGVALAKQNRLDEAADCFNAALRIDPGFAEAREGLKKIGR